MENYVVGILSLFENEVKLFKVSAENKYQAVKKAMLDFCDSEDAKIHELNYQKSEAYPKDYEGLFYAYEEIPFNIIEI